MLSDRQKSMDDHKISREQIEQELKDARQRLAELESQVAQNQETMNRLALLASFPEQNPNVVIEIDQNGLVTYMNPIAEHRFPDLGDKGFHHPLLKDLRQVIATLQDEDLDYVAREVDLGEAVFEQKVCFMKEAALVRVFAHDITGRKRAEEAVKQMADQLRGLAKRVVMAQEEERLRVSRELHDEAGQALTALKISLELIRDSLSPDARELILNLNEAISLTHTTRKKIRFLAQGLRPPVLDTLGINLALEDLCRDFSRRTQINIHYQGMEIPAQPDAIQICLYRFLQEALTNVAEHARASHILVNLELHDSQINLSVQDNGQGIDGDKDKLVSQNSKGMGLLGMRERLRLLYGKLEIDSDKDSGTRVVARLPVEVNP